MRRFFPVFLCAASCAFSQQSSPPLAQPEPEIITITPDTVVATINGRAFTAGELERISQNLSPQLKQLAGTQPKVFLEQYAYAETLVKEAEKLGIDKTSPLREQLEESRRQILTQGLVRFKTDQQKIAPEEIQKYFAANKAAFRSASVRVIFVSRAGYVQKLADKSTKPIAEEDQKAKSDKVSKLVRGGGDFVALAKEYSDDRSSAERDAVLDFPVRPNSKNMPPEMRDAILAARPGDIVGPLEHPSGFYTFRVDSIEQPEFDAVKADIEKELKDASVRRFLDEQKKKSSATMDHKAFWDTFIAANQEQQMRQQESKQPLEKAPEKPATPDGARK